ncbi:TPA: hypothetical protein GX533_03540 [Candidatus Dojkabacteria bacterium]|uniref:Uncharacterized protein n=1 Tax=Candidatus Dojkabacteria bacterium TaxID=2099670 RepID=A0A832QCF0_9BACT|nr:hypothetical protein [Candidatus Dojkabacteria bacterium]
MEVVKNFFKKYKKYILIGLAVGLTVGLIAFWEVKSRSEIGADPKNKELLSPFWDLLDHPTLSLPSDIVIYTEEEIPVYDILPYKGNVLKIIQKFDENIEITSDTSNLIETENILASYTENVGVLEVYLKTHAFTFTVKNNQDVSNLIKGIFGYETNQESIVMKRIEENIIFQGRYLVESSSKEEFGSMQIDSYAYRIETEKDGSVKRIVILLYNNNSINTYSVYPPVSIREGLKKGNAYYTKPLYQDFDKEDFSGLEFLKYFSRTKSVSVRKTSKVYILPDYNYSYLYPTYVIEGDAKLEDFLGNSHIGESLIYVLAIDSQYLKKSVEELEPISN